MGSSLINSRLSSGFRLRRGVAAQTPRTTTVVARMKIAAGLMTGFGLLVIVIAGLSGFSVYLSRDSRDTFQNVVRLKSNEVLSQRAQKRVMEGRLAVWMALATDDQSKWELADKAFKTAHQRLDEPVAGTVDPNRLARSQALEAQGADYEAPP